MSGCPTLTLKDNPDPLKVDPVATVIDGCVGCGLCGSSERMVRFEDGPFAVVECSACQMVYVTPRLKDASLIDHVYNESYWSSAAAKVHGYTDYRADAPLYKRTYEKRVSIIERHFPGLRNAAGQPLRVLDIGCAAGYFL